MLFFARLVSCLLLIASTVFSSTVMAATSINIPILCYHNLNPTVPGSMSMTPKKFESQIKWILDNGFTIIPLKDAVAYLQGTRASLPPKSVVITADDGWKSAYTYMAPIVKKYKIPVTLFIYPETISNGKNAMTWDELKELQQTGLFDIQGHTYSHPNFKQAKKRMSAEGYEKFVKNELVNSKKILEDKTGTKVILLAWPFGIYNAYLEQQAANAGYAMAFTIDYRSANRSDRAMAQPRFMIIDAESAKMFADHVGTANTKSNVVSASANMQ